MTPESVAMYDKAYRLHYQGKYDFVKYAGHISTPPLIQQRERAYYYRIARLADNQIHALFTTEYFRNPNGHVSSFAGAEHAAAAAVFAARAENGQELLSSELHTFGKRVDDMSTTHELSNWLYGNDHSMIPGCINDIQTGSLQPDLACLVLLIPVGPHRWLEYWRNDPQTQLGLGAAAWMNRLLKLDQLIVYHRPGWRLMSQGLAKKFWTPRIDALNAAQRVHVTTLFD